MADDPSNAKLVGVLEEARSHYDDELERRLQRALADSSLIVPVQRDPATGEVGVRASINPDGSRHLLGFTSTQELNGWAQGTLIDHRVMSGRDVAAVARSVQAAALWIDPASDHGGRLSSDRVDLVAAEGDALHEAIATDGAISDAWLLRGADPGAADVVLVVAGDAGAQPTLLARALGQILPAGWSGDVYPITTAELADGDYDAVRLRLQVYP